MTQADDTIFPTFCDGRLNSIGNTMSNDLAFIVAKFTKENDGQLTKSISLGDDGSLKSDGSACVMTRGCGQNVVLNGPDELAALINGLESSEALSLGKIATAKVGRQPDDIVNVVTARNLHQPRAGVIARTAEYVIFEAGEPGVMLFDVDFKGMPPHISAAIEANGGVWKTICTACPGLKSAGRVDRASTSAGISNNETGEKFTGSGGFHIYITVTNAADIPRALKVLFERLWLAGFGWITVGTSGQLLERAVIDAAVGSAERLIFEGPPVLIPPLAQDSEARQARATDGAPVDARVVLPNLSAAELAKLATLKNNARDAVRSQAAIMREYADQRLAKKIADKIGAPLSRVLEKLRHRHNGSLLPDHPLNFDDPSIGEVTAADFCKELNPSPGAFGDFGLGSSGDRETEQKKRERGDILRAALEEAAGGKGFPPGPVSAHRVGKKLQALVDRTVLCGEETLRLRADQHNEANSYSIQVIDI
jgi:hypothetical protein